VLRLPVTHPGHLFASLPGSTRSSSVRVSQSCAPRRSEAPSGPGSLFNRRPDLPVCLHVDVNGTSQVPRRSIPCLCPALRPRPNRRSLASLTVSSMLPPRFPRQRLQRLHEFRGSITRLWHLLPTLHEWRCHPPCKARFRPAGLAFTGRASNHLDRYKRFQIKVSSSFSGFILAQGKFHVALPERCADRRLAARTLPYSRSRIC
jgi:hypothetical protein